MRGLSIAIAIMRKQSHKYILTKIIFFIISVSAFSFSTTSIAHAVVQFKKITFNDLAPRGFQLDECWFGVGIDHTQKVYVGLSDRYGSGPDDVAIFRYDTNTGKRECLSTARQISQSRGNLQSNETIAKIHDSFKEHNGKIYFSSHDFHGIDNPDNHRGGHFYEYDLTSGKFDDLSRYEPEGVSIKNQGIHVMNIVPKLNMLVGMTAFQNDIVAYDLSNKKSKIYRSPEGTGSEKTGLFVGYNSKIYFAYPGIGSIIYSLDLNTGNIRRTSGALLATMNEHAIVTKDRKVAFLSDTQENFYRYDVEIEKLTKLGKLPADTNKISMMALSLNEKFLYILARDENRGLFEYNRASGTTRRIADVPNATITGMNTVDNKGRVYACFHGDNGVGLFQITNIDSSTPCEGGQCSGIVAVDTPNQCHTITSGTVPSGFGVPYDTRTNNLLIKAECANNQAAIALGDNQATTYVWGAGYQWGGSSWIQKQLQCTGQSVSGWCLDGAQTTIQTGFTIPDYVVGYICQWDPSTGSGQAGRWRCGCRDAACTQSFWQLQGINR